MTSFISIKLALLFLLFHHYTLHIFDENRLEVGAIPQAHVELQRTLRSHNLFNKEHNLGFWISGTLEKEQQCLCGADTWTDTWFSGLAWRGPCKSGLIEGTLLITNTTIKTAGKTPLYTPQNGLERQELVWNRGNGSGVYCWHEKEHWRVMQFWKTVLQSVKNTTFGLGRSPTMKHFLFLQRPKFSSQQLCWVRFESSYCWKCLNFDCGYGQQFATHKYGSSAQAHQLTDELDLENKVLFECK